VGSGRAPSLPTLFLFRRFLFRRCAAGCAPAGDRGPIRGL
jgi:hypothetical protein